MSTTCPFCRGEIVRMENMDSIRFKNMPGTRCFMCEGCKIVFSIGNSTEAEAVSVISAGSGCSISAPYSVEYRACGKCTSCGDETAIGNYCQNCGAKVIANE